MTAPKDAGTSSWEDSSFAIRVKDLSKVYRGSGSGLLHLSRIWLGRLPPEGRALDRLNFSVRRGEAVGVIGRNGSGKSTLLKLLAGSLSPTAGEVRVSGRVGTLLDLGSGINPEYTGEENVEVLGMLAGLSRRDVRARMQEIRAFSGLGDAFTRPVKSYSSGMFMRLGFSASVHTDPEILLIDEALAVGDAFFQQRCLRKMRELREQNVTIILVSHDPSAVISLCDRAIWLEAGRIADDGSPNVVIKRFLAARYRDDCELDEPLESLDDLEDARAHDIQPAPPLPGDEDRFGSGRARILGIEIRDAQGRPQSLVLPGRAVQVVISLTAHEEIQSPLVGFTLRNRLGDIVTATNTEFEGVRMPTIPPGSEVDVAFRFEWPRLSSGPYSFSPAIAEGTVSAHKMCDWVENAVVVENQNARAIFGWLSLGGVDVEIGSLRRNGEDP